MATPAVREDGIRMDTLKEASETYGKKIGSQSVTKEKRHKEQIGERKTFREEEEVRTARRTHLCILKAYTSFFGRIVYWSTSVLRSHTPKSSCDTKIHYLSSSFIFLRCFGGECTFSAFKQDNILVIF